LRPFELPVDAKFAGSRQLAFSHLQNMATPGVRQFGIVGQSSFDRIALCYIIVTIIVIEPRRSHFHICAGENRPP
jgi:hypothetical protein